CWSGSVSLFFALTQARPTGTYTLSLHDALPISALVNELHRPIVVARGRFISGKFDQFQRDVPYATFCHALESLVQQILGESPERSEEHTSELQSRENLVCRLLLEKKKQNIQRKR